MNFSINNIDHHIEEIENYLKNIKKSIKNEEFYAPEGYLYCIIEECREIITLIKPFQKNL